MIADHIDVAIDRIEASESLDELRFSMQRIVENYGFASFSFVETSRPHVRTPFYFGNSGKDWEREYDTNGFLHVDPCIAKSRRTNVPFVWAESVPPSDKRPGPKSALIRLMDAAHSFGFHEGLVVPCHFKDHLGRLHSTSGVFYWKEPASDMYAVLSTRKWQLHLLMIYFIQKCLDLHAREHKGAAIGTMPPTISHGLTDRERDVLTWSGRGKTNGEIAEILKLSEKTVETHVKHVLRKLGSRNKTHAVVQALKLGIIEF